MKSRGFGIVVLAVVVMVAIAGCTTVPKQYREEMSGIKTKVDTLESRVETVESKQLEVEKTTTEQAQAIEEMKTVKTQAGPKTNVGVLSRACPTKDRTKDIQTALKNAGFYDGRIDGIKGDQTKSAIKAFQKANGLRDDGVVGPKTWDLLSRYLSGGSAGAGAGGTSESAE